MKKNNLIFWTATIIIALWEAVMPIFTWIFAFISHFCVDKNIGFMVMPLCFLGILAVSYIYSKKVNTNEA